MSSARDARGAQLARGRRARAPSRGGSSRAAARAAAARAPAAGACRAGASRAFLVPPLGGPCRLRGRTTRSVGAALPCRRMLTTIHRGCQRTRGGSCASRPSANARRFSSSRRAGIWCRSASSQSARRERHDRRERPEDHGVHRLGVAGGERDARARRRSSARTPVACSRASMSAGYTALPTPTGSGTICWLFTSTTEPRVQEVQVAQRLEPLEGDEVVGRAARDQRREDLGAEAQVRDHAAAALGHAVDLALLDVEAGERRDLGEDLAARAAPPARRRRRAGRSSRRSSRAPRAAARTRRGRSAPRRRRSRCRARRRPRPAPPCPRPRARAPGRPTTRQRRQPSHFAGVDGERRAVRRAREQHAGPAVHEQRRTRAPRAAGRAPRRGAAGRRRRSGRPRGCPSRGRSPRSRPRRSAPRRASARCRGAPAARSSPWSGCRGRSSACARGCRRGRPAA